MSVIKKICPDVSELNGVNTNIMCPVNDCNTISKSKSNLNMHYTKHHLKTSMQDNKSKKDEIIQFHCPEASCIYNISSNRFFAYKRLLKQHYLKVHADKIFGCCKCTKSFSTLALKSSHEKVCGKLFVCPDCNWEYKSHEALLTHCRRKNHRREIAQNVENKPSVSLAENIIVLNILPASTKIMQNKEVQTDLNNITFKAPAKSRKRLTQETQTSLPKGKKHKNTVETQTTKNTILEKAMYDAKIYSQNIDKTNIGTQSGLRPNEHHQLDRNNSKSKAIIKETLKISDNILCNGKMSPQNQKAMVFDDTSTFYMNGKSDMETNASQNMFLDNILSETMLNQNNLCSIETQTERFDSSLNENTDSSFTQTAVMSLDQLLYSNMYTQTCDDILLSELGFNDSHTQTYWPDYDDLVSTETQTTFTDHLFGDRSTQTKSTVPEVLLEQSEYTKTYSSTGHGS